MVEKMIDFIVFNDQSNYVMSSLFCCIGDYFNSRMLSMLFKQICRQVIIYLYLDLTIDTYQGLIPKLAIVVLGVHYVRFKPWRTQCFLKNNPQSERSERGGYFSMKHNGFEWFK